MRIVLLAALLALAPPAAAHHDHDPCPYSVTLFDAGVVHVDRWSAGCQGVAVSTDLADCSGFVHEHFGGFHVFAVSGTGCQTGLILETLEADAATLP